MSPAAGARGSTRPTKLRVSGVSARCTLSTSLCAATASGDGTTVTSRSRGSAATGRRAVAPEPPAPHHRRHPERRRAARHLLPDAAKAKQPERAAIQAARLRVLLLVPAPGAQVGDVVRNPAVEREDQSKRKLGDGDAVPAGAVRHVDAAPRGASDVNRVDARAGPHDEGEPAGVEHRLGHLRGSNNEDVGA